jgi:ABC-type nitrate/sulfonate/bicarbonate transport system substrate-binding protein
MFAAAALAASLVLAGCESESDEVVFMAGSHPQANLPFVAAYVAEAKGYFDSEGLNVRVEHSPGGAEHVDLLEAGEVDFTTATAASLIESHGRPAAGGEPPLIAAVALFGQRGDRGYLVRRGSGIESPRDFEGKVVGSNSATAPPELHALLAGAGLTIEDVTIERVGLDDLDRLLVGQIDVYPVFINSEPDIARRLGHDVVLIDPYEFGIATLGLTVVTRRSLIEENAATVEAFLRAMLRGAYYASRNIDEAIEITLQYAPEADVDHQSYLLETDLAAAARTGGMGRSDPTQWQSMIDLITRYGAVEAPIEVTQVFDGRFIDELYGRGDLP